MVATNIWQTKLLRTCYAACVSLGWHVLLIKRLINRVCKCMFKQQASCVCCFWSMYWDTKASADWITDWWWARESMDHLILPSICSQAGEWGIKEERKNFSLSALFRMPFPVTVSFIPISPYAKTIVIIFPPSQTLCHEGVDTKLLSLAGKKQGDDGWCLHTLVCIYSWLFWPDFCFLPWHCCSCVSMLYSA